MRRDGIGRGGVPPLEWRRIHESAQIHTGGSGDIDVWYHGGMDKRAVFAGLAVVFLIVLGYVLVTLAPRFIQQTTETAPLQIALGSRTDGALYDVLPDGTLQSAPFGGEGTVVARTRRSDIGFVLSAVTPVDGIGTMLVLETATGNQVLVDPDAVRDTPAISFDGSLVAYAQLALPFGETLYSDSVADWHIYVMDVLSGETQDLGVGYAPYFISENPHVLIYSTPGGIASYVINGSETAWMSDGHPATLTARAVVASSDGTHLAAYNELTGRWSVFSITQSFPLELSAVGEPSRAFEEVDFRGRYLYGTAYNQEAGAYELWRYSKEEIEAPFSQGGAAIHSFAPEELPFQIIP